VSTLYPFNGFRVRHSRAIDIGGIGSKGDLIEMRKPAIYRDRIIDYGMEEALRKKGCK